MLKSISVPDAVTHIGSYCFAEDTVMTSAKLSASLDTLSEGLFNSCKVVNGIIIPEKVTNINKYVFRECKSLSSIRIPAATINILDGAFNGCTALADIDLADDKGYLNLGVNDNHTSSGYHYEDDDKGLFQDCPVKTLHLGRWCIYDTSSDRLSPFAHITVLDSLTIGDKVGIIGKYSFTGCTSLPKVYLPESVTSVGNDAFRDCSSLYNLHLDGQLVSVGERSFMNCVKLDNVEISASLDAISEATFSGCTSLKNINLGAELNTIGPSAFEGCTSLVSVDIPESVYGFGVESFKGCSSLDHMILPSGIKSIGKKSFENDSLLQWVSLSNKATSIGDQTFSGCTGLKYIKSYNEVPPEGLAGFDSTVEASATVFVPETAIEDYQISPTWENFKNFKPITDDVLATAMTLNENDIHLKAGESKILSATVTPENAVNKNVNWKSDDESVAKVDPSGIVTGMKVGKATITCIASDGGGAKAVCNVTVDSTLISSITLNTTSASIRKSHELQLSGVAAPETATDSTLNWTSSDTNIAIVNKYGLVRALSPGDVIITATANDNGGAKAVCNVTVLPVLKGDSNDDDEVTVVDAVNTVNYILKKATASFMFEAADVNSDNSITVSDVTGTTDIVLHQTPGSKDKTAAAKRIMTATDADHLVLTRVNSGKFNVSLDNAEMYTALQADFVIPQSAGKVTITLADALSSTHKLTCAKLNGNAVRVIVYSLDNSGLVSGSALFSIAVDKTVDAAKIQAENIIVSDTEAHGYKLGYTNGPTTGIDAIYDNMPMVLETSNGLEFNCPAGTNISVWTTSGKTIKSFTTNGSHASVNVPSGVYVVRVGEKTFKVTVK